jgi:hypothetical protein
MTTGRRRHGIALVVTLLAVVMLGIVIAGVFFGSSQEERMGRNQIHQEAAFAGAERGLAAVLAAWDGSREPQLPIGATLSRTFAAHEGVTIATSITRFTRSTYWVASEARAGPQDGARRAVGVLLRLGIPNLGPMAALGIRVQPAGVTSSFLDGDVRVDGSDVAPSGWDDCAESAPVAGIVASDTMALGPSGGDCRSAGCLEGVPPLVLDPEIGDSAGFPFAAAEWNRLVSAATTVLPGGSVVGGPERRLGPRVRDGQCDTTVAENWGDPARLTECALYFPIVHVRGDLQLVGGTGQGTLLVDGDLAIAGGARFVGAVFVRGALRTGVGGAQIVGMTRVGGASTLPSVLSSGAQLGFSRCAVEAALTTAAYPEILPRSWVELR